MQIAEQAPFINLAELQLEVSVDKVCVLDNPEQDEYLKKNVCLPYFKEIYRDLVERSNDKQKGINKITLFDYIELPGILAERLFAVFDENADLFVDLNEFVVGMFKIYVSDLDAKLRLVFDIYDFDKDGFISKDDVRTVLSYIPINKILEGKQIRKEGRFTQEGGGMEVYLDRVQSQEEIDKMLEMCFGEKEKVSYSEFVTINQEDASDLLFTVTFYYIISKVLNFLREKLPCSENFWRYEKGVKKSEDAKKSSVSPVKSTTVASPKHLSKFSPLSPLIKQSSFGSRKSTKDSPNNTQVLLKYALANKQLEKNSSNSESDEPTFPESKDSEAFESACTNSIPISNFKSNQLSKLESLQRSSSNEGCDSPYMNHSSGNAIRMPNVASADQNSAKTFSELVTTKEGIQSPSAFLAGKAQRSGSGSPYHDNKDSVRYEGELLKRAGENVLKKCWLSLENKELFFYKNKDEAKHKAMHSLVGVFIKEELEVILDKKTILHPFKLIFPHKTRTYYSLSKTEKDNWVEAIKKAVGYANLFDYYDVKEKLGQGKFGLVRAAVHKKTGKRVAVKVIKKKDMSTQDLELLKREMEILKICQHPNIIRLLDIFENIDFIYIVMELLKGGDLFAYLEKRNFKVSEARARSIIHSLATSVYYLHSYGIAHRDIKPENILMVDEAEDSDVKLVDFGLSKIIGPNETCKEPFGTLSYVAPEVLLQFPYGKAVDLWSIGIITYLLLSGSLPFDDDDDKEVARQTVLEPADFSHSVWMKISRGARSFVERLLIKDPKRRMTLEQALQHPWLTNGESEVSEMRGKSMKDKISKFKAYSHSQPDSPKIMEEIERRSNEDDVGGF